MKETQMRFFEQPGLVACVLLANGGHDYLEVDERGTLVIPAGAVVTGFHLVVAFEDGNRVVVVQKNVGTEGGDYASLALAQLKDFAPGLRTTIMRDPIEVIRAGQSVWAGWHLNQASNRVDCWSLSVDGKLDLYQVGIKTNDNGATWKLHGEYRWQGQLYRRADNSLVAVPNHIKWGSLEGGSSRRTQIFANPEFAALIESANLPQGNPTPAEIDPPLPQVPQGENLAVVQWYISFAGQTGQGPANLQTGTGWIHGADIVGLEPDEDGEKRLWRGDVVSYTGKVANWGAKKNGPPKLTGVKLISRAW